MRFSSIISISVEIVDILCYGVSTTLSCRSLIDMERRYDRQKQ